MAGTVGDGGRDDRGSQFPASNKPNYLYRVEELSSSPNSREVKTFERAAPEAQSYLILIHILLAFSLLVRRATGIQTPERVEARGHWS